MDDQRSRWYTRKDAVERGNEKVDVQRLFLSARLHRSRGRGKRKRFLLRALEQLARDLLICAVFLETLPHLILPPEELRLVIGRCLAWQQANRLEQEKARGHPQKFRHLLRIRDLTRCDFHQVGVGHLREGDLEDVHLLPLDQCEEELQWTFEHWSVDIQLGAHRSARRLHDAQAYLRATSCCRLAGANGSHSSVLIRTAGYNEAKRSARGQLPMSLFENLASASKCLCRHT